MSSNLGVQGNPSNASMVDTEIQSTAKPSEKLAIALREQQDLDQGIAALDAASRGEFGTALSLMHSIGSRLMRDEIEQMVSLAQEYGPVETAATSLNSRLQTLAGGKNKEKVDLNEHMRDFIVRSMEQNPPDSKDTQDLLNKLLNGEELSGKDASQLFAYLEESKVIVLPQGKRSEVLAQQIQGLQDRYEKEHMKVSASIRAMA